MKNVSVQNMISSRGNKVANQTGGKMKDITFKSGDDKGTDVKCYNCGKEFRESVKEEDIENGIVVCDCGGRIAYIEA